LFSRDVTVRPFDDPYVLLRRREVVDSDRGIWVGDWAMPRPRAVVVDWLRVFAVAAEFLCIISAAPPLLRSFAGPL
jgi:hypothetical protein